MDSLTNTSASTSSSSATNNAVIVPEDDPHIPTIPLMPGISLHTQSTHPSDVEGSGALPTMEVSPQGTSPSEGTVHDPSLMGVSPQGTSPSGVEALLDVSAADSAVDVEDNTVSAIEAEDSYPTYSVKSRSGGSESFHLISSYIDGVGQGCDVLDP